MKKKHHSSRSRNLLKKGIAIAGFSAVASGAWAQSVFIPPPSMPAPSAAPSGDLESEGGMVSAADLGFSLGPGLSFRWRKLYFRPRIAYGFLYGDGILASAGNPKKTVVQTMSPGLAVDIGEHWKLDYRPAFVFYSDPSFEDSLNHSLIFSGSLSSKEWDYGISLGMRISSDPETETGQQTDEVGFTTSLSASRQLNNSTSIELSAGVDFRINDDFNSSRIYRTMNWINSQYGPNLGFGLGLGGGYEDASSTADSIYEQVQGRIIWTIIDRLSLSLSGGPEFRQYADTGIDTRISPVYGGTLTYQVFDPTTLSIGVNRSTRTSRFADSLTDTTSFISTLNQRLLGKLSLNISGGYTFSSYESTTSDVTNREDTRTFVSISLGTSFLKRGSASVFYSVSSNTSDVDVYSYDSDQIGFNIAYRY